MKTELLDAVKTITSIHKGDFSFLSGKSFLACDSIKNKKRRSGSMKKKKTLTLSQLAEKIDNLGNDIRNEMNDGFKQVNARLDYIVKANNLKDSPNNK